MANVSISLEEFNISDEEIKIIYKKYKEELKAPDVLDDIFNIILKYRKMSPTYSISKNKCSCENYIRRWIKAYMKADKNLPSKHVAKPKKACTDDVLKFIIQKAIGCCSEEICKFERYHNLYMSAENIQGALLEEYIANNIEKLGWIWCKGCTIKSTDFCKKDGSAFLQIKNKYNTENSSSNKIRENLPVQVEPWYRLGRNGEKRWNALNSIIKEHTQNDCNCNLTEEDYITFVSKVAAENKQIVSEK